MKLDIGCGNNKHEGCIGLDIVKLNSVDIIADISKGLPFRDNTFEEIFCHDLLEHFESPIDILEEIWRVARPDAKVSIRVPYCQSYGAFRDPTHKSFFHEETMNHFLEYTDLPNWYSHIRFDIIDVSLTTPTALTSIISKVPKISKNLWNIYSRIDYLLGVKKFIYNENYTKISIIILNWNGLEDTVECIESLQRLSYPNREIILVDNGSTDGSQEAVRERFQDVILVQNSENLGFAAGMGEGIRYASGEYIAFLNNDTVVDSRWLDELVKPFLTMDGKIGATSSTIFRYDNREEVEYGGDSKMNIFGQTWASDRVEFGIEETRTISGAAFMMKKEVIDGLEEFLCPEYFAYYEEIDLSWRLINKGFRLIYSPKSIVYHKGGMTSINLSTRMRIYKIRNKYLTFYRNLSNSRLLLVFPFLLAFDIASILALILFVRRTRYARLRLQGLVEFLKLRGQVRRYRNGRISFLEKHIFLDKLHISTPVRW